MTGVKREVKKAFDVDAVLSDQMESLIARASRITQGRPDWVDDEDGIRSLSFASYVDTHVAQLVCLNMKVTIEGGTARARALQKDVDYLMENIVDHVGEGLGNVGIMFKPNGESIDYVEAGDFVPLASDSNGHILGCAFKTSVWKDEYKYTRLERHEFLKDGRYQITNKAYKSKKAARLGEECPLTEVDEWADLAPVTIVEGLEAPLYAYFKNPAPNTLEKGSPLGLPIWYPAITELQDLDIAWSRKANEMADSTHVTFVPQSAVRYAEGEEIKLPRFVRGLEMGSAIDETIHDHVATLLTDQRVKDINSILGMISAKCGLSQSTFKLDEKQGLMTATEVEADDQETVRTVKTIRDALETAIRRLVYALDKMHDNAGDTPAGAYEVGFDFGDITYNYEEDRQTWLSYVLQGLIPKWKYLEKFERMTEEEAKALVAEAEGLQQVAELFGTAE